MQCPRCQHENPAGQKFCGECAAPLVSACDACGAANPPSNKFCGQCAAPLRKAEKARAPDTYTPRHLAEKILTSKSALEGERKQVTILFADLKGSMELLADRDPEDARKILDPVLELMMEAVHRYEGTVNQVMGDGIMALFGAPLAHEDHAVRACYAALRMQEALKRYTEDTRRSYGVEVQIRVGLNSGEVIVRAIGSDLHMDYTAVGQVTHLAARMEQMTPPGTVRLTSETVRLAEGYVEVRSLGPIPVKGLPDPIEVYELTGAGTARTRLQAAVVRGLTRFVGRDGEIEYLRRVLGQAGTGRGQVVAIVGEAGVGKSRLVYEFTHTHRVQDWLILGASCVSYGKTTSYLPVVDLLRGYFKIGDRDDPREIQTKVLGRVLGLDRRLEPLLPPLLALLDVPVEDMAWQHLDPPQRRQRTLDAVKGLLLRESQVQPLLLVFEDLHWIDGETQALLDSLVESLGSARLLLLVNYRPEYEHRWESKTAYSRLRLDSLPAASAADLLATLLGPDPGLAPLTQMLVKRGNPFFLEETVRTLVETGALAGERGAYRLTRPLDVLEVPATVQTILAARIDRLPPEEKRLLQAAAVIGEDVPFALLHAISEEPEEMLHRGLAHLRAAEFLYEARLFPDIEYTFKHGLTYQVAYTSLLQERRRVLHARIVAALERLYPDRLTEQLERLAYHAVRGEVWEKAASYLQRSGAKAFAHSANRQAVTCYEEALLALSHVRETPQKLEQEIDLRFDLRTALYPLGEMNRIVSHLREAERLARVRDDQGRLGWVSVYMAHYSQATGDCQRARESAKEALSIGETLGDFALQIGARHYLGWSALTLGDYFGAEGYLRGVIGSLEPDHRRERCNLTGYPAAMARWLLAMCLAALGALDEAIMVGREGVRIAEELDHAYSLILACWGPVDALRIKGELDAAMLLGERALALCRDRNIPGLSPLVTAVLGDLYARSGRVAEGVELLEKALASIESMRGASSWDGLFRVHLGEAYARIGRIDQAGFAADRALVVTRERGHRGYQARALRLLGEVTARRDPPEHAAGHYRDALTLATELGMRPLVAHCHLGLGRLHGRTGNHQQAQEDLTTATTMYREMGMTYWLEKAEAEMRELD